MIFDGDLHDRKAEVTVRIEPQEANQAVMPGRRSCLALDDG